MRDLSIMELICYLIALFAMILVIGTAGAVETGTLATMHGVVRCGIFLAVSGAAVFVGRNYA